MHHFHNFSSASAGLRPRPLRSSTPGPRWDFRVQSPDPLIRPSLEKIMRARQPVSPSPRSQTQLECLVMSEGVVCKSNSLSSLEVSTASYLFRDAHINTELTRPPPGCPPPPTVRKSCWWSVLHGV